MSDPHIQPLGCLSSFAVLFADPSVVGKLEAQILLATSPTAAMSVAGQALVAAGRKDVVLLGAVSESQAAGLYKRLRFLSSRHAPPDASSA